MATSDRDSGVNVKERMKQFQQKGDKTAPVPMPTKPQTSKPKPERQKSRTKKSDSPLFKEPHRFVFTDEKTGQLRCDEKTLKLLSQLDIALNVVGITGLYRTGKSYLLNRLAGEKKGFKTGNKIHACTKGIWIWCRHHPVQEDQALVLLDVEGFGDLEKVNRDEDTWLFTLATVLSSTLVYNNKDTLDAYALDRLNFLEEIDSTIQVSQNEEDKKLLDLDFFFPTFVVTLRDFRLEMVSKSGEDQTPDEYLEGLLVQKRGEGKNVEVYNRIRLLIRRYFKKRKCFVFMQPCGPKAKLEKLSDKDLEPDFLRNVEMFSEYVFSLKPLQLKSGRNINGRMFANLALHYVMSISKKEQPSILDATRYMVDIENRESVATAGDIYKKKMQEFIANMGDMNPTDMALVETHERCLATALDYFKRVVVFDDEEVFKRQAMSACRSLLSRFKRICDENSTNACAVALARLNKRIEKKLKSGAYACESGYDEYIKDINWIVRQYTGLAGLGSKVRGIMQGYLDGKEAEEELVYKLVLQATTGEGNKAELRQEMRRPSLLNDLSANVTRSTSFRHTLQVKVENMEDKMNQELEAQCQDNKKKIQENYIENLEMKIKELERQKSEAYGNSTALAEVESQIAYFEKVLDYSKSLKEGTEDGVSSEDKEEQTDTAGPDDLGERPTTIGGSLENTFEELQITSEPRKKKSLCRVQ